MILIETTFFSRIIQSLLSDEEYRALQKALILQPDLGALISGSGGLRKLRWSFRGKGKRGGVRVIYYLVTQERILMLYINQKGQQENLTQEQLKRLKRIIEEG